MTRDTWRGRVAGRFRRPLLRPQEPRNRVGPRPDGAGAAALYWSRPVAAPPETSAAAPAAPVASMTTWLEVEPVRAGVRQDAYESVGGDTLADGWKVRVHVSPRAAGYLTVLSDATVRRNSLSTLTVLHPPTLSGQRSVTDWNVIDGQPADIAIWVIWSPQRSSCWTASRPTRTHGMPGSHGSAGRGSPQKLA